MKRTAVFAAFCLFCLSAAVSCRSSAGKGGVRDIVTNENTEADLGTIYEKDGTVQVNLLVPNESPDTLFPASAYTYCGCVSAEADRSPVPPGGNVKVGVVYNPAYRSGIVMEEIFVKMLNGRSLSLVIKGVVIPAEHPVEEDHPYDFGSGLHLSHEVLHYGKLSAGERGDIFIRYASGAEKEIGVAFVANPALDGIVASRSGLVLPPGGRDTLHFRFTMPEGIAPGDTLKLPVHVSVDGKVQEKSLLVKAISK